MKVVNALGSAVGGGGVNLFPLTEDYLLTRARQQTGLDDFGDEGFRKPLRVLLDAFPAGARLNFVGRLCVQADLLRLLTNRLQLVADRRRYPEIGAEVIRRPWFITGLPRSGTTFLHALLAQDPAGRAPRVWEVMHPSPPPATAAYHTDDRIAQTARELWWLRVLMPDFHRVHLINAALPQECIAITAHAFLSYVFESMYYLPDYRRWHDAQDKVPAYEYHRRFLQHLQWRCPGSHWVLKAPSHALALEALVQVYPDAGVIMTHRDPLKVLPSCASFTEVMRLGFIDHQDRRELAQEICSRWQHGSRLILESHRHQLLSPSQRVDVHYPDLVRDPLSVVRDIYRQFDMEFSRPAQEAMKRFLAAHPQNKKGVHHYALEDFGLRADEEASRFKFYTDYFDIKPE